MTSLPRRRRSIPIPQAGDGYAAVHRRADFRSLCAMALESMGLPCVSLTAWQVGIQTTSVHWDARIKRIDSERVQAELDPAPDRAGHRASRAWIGPGTLRPWAGAAATPAPWRWRRRSKQTVPDLHGCGRCLYHGPPHRPQRQKAGRDHLRRNAGAGVSGARCSTTAAWSWPRSSGGFGSRVQPGAQARHESQGGHQSGKTTIAGVAKDTSIARVALIGLQHNPGVAFQVFDLLSKHNINVDVILQSIGREDTKDITFTVHKKDLEDAQAILDGKSGGSEL